MHNFLKRTLTKFLYSSDLEWDEIPPFTCYSCNIFPSSNCTEYPFFLMFGWDPAEGHLSHHNNSKRYYRSNLWKIVFEETSPIMEAPYKTCKRTAPKKWAHTPRNNMKNPKFEIGQPVMVMHHVHHIFEPKYLLDYRELKILNDRCQLQRKGKNSNDVKPCSTAELVENALDSFLGSIKAKCQNSNYNIRP